ncbi:MAG TPA: hypothetical protein VKU19_28175 [Bryobacteraceae bacterium]|nr:hypothetical protein [Bryobacteraceae bacterium]
MGKRALTAGEIDMLKSVYGKGINYSAAQVHDEKWIPFQPDDTAMTPNGEMYWPPKHYSADFSKEPIATRAWFVHEGCHLYQYYGLGWSVIARGIVSRNYNYTLDPKKTKLSDYGLEEMGDIASDYYTLTQGGTITKKYVLKDYASLLPIP